MGEGWCRAQWGLLGLLPKEGKEDSKLSKGSLVDRWQMCKDNAREPVGNKVTSVGVGLDDVEREAGHRIHRILDARTVV